MKLLARISPSRRPAATRGMWEFHTGREDVPRVFFHPNLRSGLARFGSSPRLTRLTARQLHALLANNHAHYLRPRTGKS